LYSFFEIPLLEIYCPLKIPLIGRGIANILNQFNPILPYRIIFSAVSDGVVVSMYFISYQSPI
jgi:hypothetical protein